MNLGTSKKATRKEDEEKNKKARRYERANVLLSDPFGFFPGLGTCRDKHYLKSYAQ